MEFNILGPLEVRDRGRPIALRGRKQRTLLALMLLRPRQTLSMDALIDGLWGERPPRTARAALQNYVAQLRRALGPGLVTSDAGGYRLEAAPEQVDLGRFERLAAEGRAADGEERVEKLQQALALWRGPPLADLAFEPFAAEEAGRLDDLRAAALEDLIDAKLALGGGPDLVGELERLIAEHPFRERLRGQLMLALYRGGRQAEALEAYQETRRTLVGELGIEPSAPLRELEQAILRQDASLGARPRPAKEPPAPMERRKTVTVLLADIASPETLDPELLHRTSVGVLTSVRSVLEAHGATVEQRAGDEVMAVFGVPSAHEDDALRSARAALELRAQVGTQSDLLEAHGRIELRIGIETGEVLAGADEAGHGFISGPAITHAKRLVQRAGPDEILAGPTTLRLLGDAVVPEPVDDAARIVELVEGVPALRRHLEAPLADREAELAALRDAYARTVEERRCRLVPIFGEAGIGKTRLARELAAEVDGSATVLVGRCVSYGKGATYLPVAEIVGQVRARTELRERLDAADEAELVTTRLAELAGDEGAAAGGETFWAFRRLLEALAVERPVLLVFDDVHWAEPTLLDLIEYLAERTSDAPVLLLALARPEVLEERSGWGRSETTTLAPLSSEDGEALIENLGHVPAELRRQILGRAAGNPLFIEQLLAHATEDGEREALPPSLEALLASRLDRLDPGELAVLQRAAVTAGAFSPATLRHLLPPEAEARVDAHVAALVRKGLLREAGRGRFRFGHVLIREAAYGTLPKAQRAELHERVARRLESRPVRSDELIGFHFEQAHRYLAELGPVGPEGMRLGADAGEHLSAAGLRAARSGDTPAASNLLRRACALLDARNLAARDLLTELGLVLWRAGDLEAVEETFGKALEAAVSEHDRRAELRARLELAYLRLFRAPEEGAEELFSNAAEALRVLEQHGDDRTLGRVWYVLAHVHGGFRCRYRESAEAAEQAIPYFVRSGWPAAPCLQELAASLYFGPVAVPDAITRCESLLEQADLGGQANVLVFLAGLEGMAGRFDRARELASRARMTYEELDWTDKIWANYAPIAAETELLAGAYVEADRLLAESCNRLEAWGEQARLATQAARLGEALYCQQRFEEALRWSEVAELAAGTDDASAELSWRPLRAKCLARTGAFAEAREQVRKAVEIAAATDAVSQHAYVLLDSAQVLRLEERGQDAAEAIEKAIGLLDEKGNVAGAAKARSFLRELAHA